MRSDGAGDVIVESQSSTFDSLLLQSAVGHVQTLVDRRHAEGQPDLVFSMGPHLSVSEEVFMSALQSFTSPSPAPTGAPAIEDEDFQFAVIEDEEEAEAGRPVPTWCAQSILFFHVVHTHANTMKLPPGAPRVAPQNVVVQMLEVSEFDMDQERVRYFLESSTAQAQGKTLRKSEVLKHM